MKYFFASIIWHGLMSMPFFFTQLNPSKKNSFALLNQEKLFSVDFVSTTSSSNVKKVVSVPKFKLRKNKENFHSAVKNELEVENTPAGNEQNLGNNSFTMYTPAPDYPQESLLKQEEGEVVLKVLSDKMGAVTKVHVLTSSGHPNLDEAALVAVKSWTIKPWFDGEVPIIFRLEE